MEDGTPIYQLQQNPSHVIQDSRKEPLEMMSYNDILKNMSDKPTVAPKPIVNNPPRRELSVPVQMEEPQQQQPMGLPYYPQPIKPNTHVRGKPESKIQTMDSFQNEMLALLGVYVVVHTQQFQQSLQLKVPGLFSENGTPSVVGTVMNGVLVIVLWNVFKKFLMKYMKDL
jgi:hypothetical protein